MSPALFSDLFKQDSYQRANPKRWAFLLSQLPRDRVCDFGVSEGALNCLLEIGAPNKQIRLTKMGAIPLCPMGMVFTPHYPVFLLNSAQTEKKADIMEQPLQAQPGLQGQRRGWEMEEWTSRLCMELPVLWWPSRCRALIFLNLY